MFKKFENFLVERRDRWIRVWLLSFFFAFPLWRCLLWAIPLGYWQILTMLIAIGLLADFVSLVVRQEQS